MPRVDGKIVTVYDSVDCRWHIAEVEFRVYPLCVQIEGESNDVDVACTLAIAEQAPFYSVSTSKDAKLGCCNCLSPVIVVVQADNNFFSLGDVRTKVLDLGQLAKTGEQSARNEGLLDLPSNWGDLSPLSREG